MRTHERRHADGNGLDQILTTDGNETATDERDIGGGTIRKQVAQRVAKQDARGGGDGRCGALAYVGNAARGQDLGHSVEALRMTRHDDRQHVDWQGVGRGECIEHERFFAVASRRSDPHRPRRADALAQRAARHTGRCGDVDIELEIAGDRHVAGAQRAQPRRIVFALRGNPREQSQQRTRQGRDARIPGRRSRGQARVDEEQRHARRAAARGEVWP